MTEQTPEQDAPVSPDETDAPPASPDEADENKSGGGSIAATDNL